MKNKRMVLFFILFLITVTVFCIPAFGAGETERNDGYYTVVDEQGNEILATSQQLRPGDVFISANNIEYRVVKIKGNNVYTKKIGNVELLDKKAKSIFDKIGNLFSNGNGEKLAAQADGNRPICIYHSHDDESYIPSDGSESIRGKGGIVKVGQVMAEAFEKNGVPTVHSEVSHAPHDGMAYERSRATAAQLLKKRPAALIDVHRDAAPASKYAKVIGGKGFTQMIMVMGNQNPSYQSNVAFAKKVKANIDKKYPGLMKGILIKNGKYNQDLSPHAILVEFGGQHNARESAERTAAAFAAATSNMMGGTGTQSAQGTNVEEKRANTSSGLIWIVVIALGGGAAFLFLNENGLKGVKSKLSQVKRTEFANALDNDPDDKENKTDGNQKDQD